MSSTPVTSVASDLAEPPVIPDFELLRVIGVGGFGRVWLARNLATGQWRAVKVIPRSSIGAADPAGREVVALTLLEANFKQQHSCLLPVHHVGQTREHLFCVMDLADDANGQPLNDPAAYVPATLQRRLADGPLEAADSLDCATRLLGALDALHAAGMVHRDVKPSNCLLVGGQLKLADFGLLTQTGRDVSRIGTEKYMPPDGRMDARADVYAAGLVVYEMVTGWPADQFPQLGPRAAQIAADERLSALVRLSLRACQADPTRRYQSAGEMLAALQRPKRDRTKRPWRRNSLLVAGVCALAAALLPAALIRRPPSLRANFVSQPYGATVFVDGKPLLDLNGAPLTTPCTADNLPPGEHRVLLRLPLREDADAGTINFATAQQVEAAWPREPGSDDFDRADDAERL
jgi:serine/threonine protein kinase